eukprot:SAG31_NODE_43628_length_266_cov_0.658683_1_plen_65_part_10
MWLVGADERLGRLCLALLTALQLGADVTSQMIHGQSLPRWEPTYQMSRSPFLMTCNNTGAFDSEF